MNLSYIISAYKYPIQLARLVNKLNTNEVSFFIHVDKKTSPIIFDQIHALLSHLSNVYFLDRHNCYWGDFGHVEATIKGLRAGFKEGINFDYAILLTGQCYPIKSNVEIKQFFETHQGKSFIKYYPVESRNWSQRIDRWHFRFSSRGYVSFPNRYLPLPIKRPSTKLFKPYFRGSSYWCLSRECIKYVLDFIDDDLASGGKFMRFFNGVYIPDEFFFQTILLNSTLKEKVVNEDLWFIKWAEGNYVPNPSILDVSPDEMLSSQKLFARKFDLNQTSTLLDKIDELTGGNELLPLEQSSS